MLRSARQPQFPWKSRAAAGAENIPGKQLCGSYKPALILNTKLQVLAGKNGVRDTRPEGWRGQPPVSRGQENTGCSQSRAVLPGCREWRRGWNKVPPALPRRPMFLACPNQVKQQPVILGLGRSHGLPDALIVSQLMLQSQGARKPTLPSFGHLAVRQASRVRKKICPLNKFS